ncbi:MAG TPA: helix-turn-helix domain-containing protein [Gemmatimonadaceae bacterium]|jgi:AraC-like DNA-binding protein|nr:helix-turn-helix domain-containing protein [Gemmatimonadaceae bacterium]
MADGHAWELIRRLPHPALRSAVLEYQGYRERVQGTLRRRELPSAGITVIINLGPPLVVDGRRLAESFVAGLCTSHSLVDTIGEMEGVEVRLTPTGARRLFGIPMSDLANRVVPLDDILSLAGRAAIARIREAATWQERFALLERELASRLDRAPGTPAVLAHAWRQLAATDGRVSIRALAKEAAWSPKRLVATFRDQAGLPPKQVARLFRFQRAVGELARPDARLTAVAYSAGYYDQAHLIREVREFAGVTPTELVRQIHPDLPGLIDG